MSSSTARREVIARTVLFILGALAAALFLTTKNSKALAWVTSGSLRYGDLYRLAQVKFFQPAAPLPLGPLAYVDSIEQARPLKDDDRWIFVGDSFGFIDWSETPFHTQLAREFGPPVFNVCTTHRPLFRYDPTAVFDGQKATQGTERVMVCEIAERLIDNVFAKPLTPESSPGKDKMIFERLRTINYAILKETEERHVTALKHSFVTAPIVELWNSATFTYLGQMPVETPLYSVDPPFLFYGPEVASFETRHDDQQIDQLAGNIAQIARDLREQHRCKLIFVPVPNKITVYSRLATKQPYDEFLPRLCAALKARGVETVELLPLFRRESELLYWPTDSHWNNRGIRLAVEETARHLRQHLVSGESLDRRDK